MKQKVIEPVLGICLLAMVVMAVKYGSIRVTGSGDAYIKETPVVVVDAGHGGTDPGKVGVDGSLEKDINLAVAERLKTYLEQDDVKVIMTRETDTGLYSETDSRKKMADMKKRCEIIEESGADLVVSIHQNSYHEESVSGGQVFYYRDSSKGKALAEILQDQDPFFCKSLTEYFADLDTALAIIREEGNSKILLMAHSTGGLITPYYLNSKQGKLPVDGLILNSPFLDWNFGWMMEKIVIPVVSCIGKLFPNLTVQGYGDASYAHSLLKQFKGEWVYNTDWKMINGHPKKAGWINAIQAAQKKVQKGIRLDCPVLVMSSDKSFPETKDWNNEYLSSDIVLNVHDIQKYGQKLGNAVTRDTIQNGMHDLILSEKDSREHAYRSVFNWLQNK